jgi:hypothetical protein
MVITTFKGKTMSTAVDRGEDGRTDPNPDTFAYIPG